MRAIFHKQLRDAAGPCALLALIALFFFESGREFDVTRRPGLDGSASLVAFAWGIAGLALGLFAAAGDEARGARAYLFHRALSRQSILLAQTLANLAALTGALVLVVGVDAALAHLRHDPLAQPPPLLERYGELALLSTAAVLGHGVGFVGGLIRHAWIVRLLCTFYAACGTIYLTFVVLRGVGDRWIANEFAWLLWTLGAGAGLHLLAARMLAQGVDDERPLAGPLRGVFAACALGIAAPATVLTAALVQRMAIESSVRAAPILGAADAQWIWKHDRDARAPLETELFDPHDRHDIRLGAEEARHYFVERRRRVLELGAGWRPLVSKPEWLRTAKGHFAVETWIGARNGRILVQAAATGRSPSTRTKVELAPPGLEFPYRRELSRGDGRALSQALVLLPAASELSGWLIADAADRTLWRLDLAPALPTLTQVGEAQAWIGLDVALDRAVVEREGPGSPRSSTRTVLRTPSGRRSWSGAELVAADLGPDEVWQSECDGLQRYIVDVRDGDALEPRVAIVDGRGELAPLEHHYRAALGPGLVAHAASLLRSPLGSLRSALDTDSRRPTALHEWRDPLVAGGRRSWLLALNVGVSLALALMLARRRTLGLRWSWFALFALFGPLTALLAGALEPVRRAPAGAPLRAALLITSRPAPASRKALAR